MVHGSTEQVRALSLEVSEAWPGKAVADLGWCQQQTCSRQEAGLETPRGSFPSPFFGRAESVHNLGAFNLLISAVLLDADGGVRRLSETIFYSPL